MHQAGKHMFSILRQPSKKWGDNLRMDAKIREKAQPAQQR